MTGIDLKATSNGILLPVQAHAGARRNQVAGVHDGRLKVSVTQAPEQGKANKEILKLLATVFKLPRNRVSLVSGHQSSRKVFCLVEMTLQVVEEHLAAILKRDE